MRMGTIAGPQTSRPISSARPILPRVGEESAVEHTLYCSTRGPRSRNASSTGRSSTSCSSGGSDRAIPATPITSYRSASSRNSGADGNVTSNTARNPTRANCTIASVDPVKSSP